MDLMHVTCGLNSMTLIYAFEEVSLRNPKNKKPEYMKHYLHAFLFLISSWHGVEETNNFVFPSLN
jgi:hypothetical protein